MTRDIDRIMRLEGIGNFRDFGGWRAAGGAQVATGRLFRCATLHRATESDLARIVSLSIATVTDLRHASEQRAQPSAWIGKLPLALIEVPVAHGAGPAERGFEPPHLEALRANLQDLGAMREFLAAIYSEMPFDARLVALFRRYFETLAQDDRPCLIHCAAGKDRTGVLAWLTHRVLGVHRDDAMDDFLLSNAAGDMDGRLRQARRYMERVYGINPSDAAVGALLSVEPDYIHRCEAALVAHSGSVDSYLEGVLAIDPVRRDQIRALLLA